MIRPIAGKKILFFAKRFLPSVALILISVWFSASTAFANPQNLQVLGLSTFAPQPNSTLSVTVVFCDDSAFANNRVKIQAAIVPAGSTTVFSCSPGAQYYVVDNQISGNIASGPGMYDTINNPTGVAGPPVYPSYTNGGTPSCPSGSVTAVWPIYIDGNYLGSGTTFALLVEASEDFQGCGTAEAYASTYFMVASPSTYVPTFTPTNTFTSTNTSSPTSTAGSLTPTATNTSALTSTPTNSFTPTPVFPSATPTVTPSGTWYTSTPTNSPTNTISSTPTNSPSPTPTPVTVAVSQGSNPPGNFTGLAGASNVTVQQVQLTNPSNSAITLTGLTLTVAGTANPGFLSFTTLWDNGTAVNTAPFSGTTASFYFSLPLPASSSTTLTVTTNFAALASGTYSFSTTGLSGFNNGQAALFNGLPVLGSTVTVVQPTTTATPTGTWATSTNTTTPTNTPTVTMLIPTPACAGAAVMGYSTVQSIYAIPASSVAYLAVTAQGSGAVSNVHFFGLAGGTTVDVGLYSDNGGQPGSLLSSSGPTVASGNINNYWMTFALNTPVSVIAGNSYWLAIGTNFSLLVGGGGTGGDTYLIQSSSSLPVTYSNAGVSINSGWLAMAADICQGTPILTATPTNSLTPTPVLPTATPTVTPSGTWYTSTPTVTSTITSTPTNTISFTVTNTLTGTLTNTPSATAPMNVTTTPTNSPTAVTVAVSQWGNLGSFTDLAGSANVTVEQLILTNPANSTVSVTGLALTVLGPGNPADVTSAALSYNGSTVSVVPFSGATASFSFSSSLPAFSSVTLTATANFDNSANGTYVFEATGASGFDGQAVLFSGLPVSGATVTIVQPTVTATPTVPLTSTPTVTPSGTWYTSTPTSTPTVSDTSTATSSSTATFSPTITGTLTATGTPTTTPTGTWNTPTKTTTNTFTSTPTGSPATGTPSSTITYTPTSTPTAVTVAVSGPNLGNFNELAGASNVTVQDLILTNPGNSSVTLTGLTLTVSGTGNPANITSAALWINGTAIDTTSFSGTTASYSISSLLPAFSSVTLTVTTDFATSASGSYSFSATGLSGSNGQALLFSGLPVSGALVTVVQPTITATPTVFLTYTPTVTPTGTWYTSTPTGIPTPSYTPTSTNSPTATSSSTATGTPTSTPTGTWYTSTPIITNTPVATPTAVTVVVSQGPNVNNSTQLVGSSGVSIQTMQLENPGNSAITLTSLTLTVSGSGNPANITSVTLLDIATVLSTTSFSGTTATFAFGLVIPANIGVTLTATANFGNSANGSYDFSAMGLSGSNGQAVLFSGLPVSGATVAVVQPTFTPTNTNIVTLTNTPTNTMTATFQVTGTPSSTATNTPTGGNTNTPTVTTTNTPTNALTNTPTFTFTSTVTPTISFTPTSTPAGTPITVVYQPVNPSQPATITLAGGVTVSMGANTLAQAITMTITEYAASSAPVSQGALQISFMPDVYLIDSQGLEPQGGMSVTITLPYNPANIPSGYTTADLSISYYNGTQWVTLPVTVNTANDTVTVVTNHFSWWAVTLARHTPTPAAGGGKNFLVYPNPAMGNQVGINVLSGSGTFDLKVQVFTTDYRKVRDVTIPHVSAGSTITLALLDKAGVQLSNGLYYVVLTTPQNHSVLKLLVLR